MRPESNRIARVFPRRTNATPNDELSFVGPPGLFPPEVDEVHISVAFTWDIPVAQRLADQWRLVAPVKIGGPAMGSRGEDFTPGLYLRPGYLITSRCCPNRCWFCSVPGRDGAIRELAIREGWNVLDDNLLACSESHVRAVFSMLGRQAHRIELTGGLEAARLKDWHIDLLDDLRPKQMFLAYDCPEDWEPLRFAVERLRRRGFTRHHLRAYVLIGYHGDSLSAAESRLRNVQAIGCDPMAMLWRGPDGKTDPEWRRVQRSWARPALMHPKSAGKEANDAA